MANKDDPRVGMVAVIIDLGHVSLREISSVSDKMYGLKQDGTSRWGWESTKIAKRKVTYIIKPEHREEVQALLKAASSRCDIICQDARSDRDKQFANVQEKFQHKPEKVSI